MEAAGVPSMSLSPTFTSHSNTGLSGITAKVVNESDSRQGSGIPPRGKGDADFAFSTYDSELQSPQADEIFQNGAIRPVYPAANTTRRKAVSFSDEEKVFVEEKEESAAVVEERPVMKKSTSLGNISRRMQFKGLLHRGGSYIFLALHFNAKKGKHGADRS